MRHFAIESGKSKGQFYTAAEVSRVMAQVIRIREAQTDAATTVSNPTCGAGFLFLKVVDEVGIALVRAYANLADENGGVATWTPTTSISIPNSPKSPPNAWNMSSSTR